jgi:hypothetical protein
VHVGTLTSGEYDSTISLELLETDGTRARNGGHLVTGASELVAKMLPILPAPMTAIDRCDVAEKATLFIQVSFP